MLRRFFNWFGTRVLYFQMVLRIGFVELSFERVFTRFAQRELLRTKLDARGDVPLAICVTISLQPPAACGRGVAQREASIQVSIHTSEHAAGRRQILAREAYAPARDG